MIPLKVKADKEPKDDYQDFENTILEIADEVANDYLVQHKQETLDIIKSGLKDLYSTVRDISREMRRAIEDKAKEQGFLRSRQSFKWFNDISRKQLRDGFVDELRKLAIKQFRNDADDYITSLFKQNNLLNILHRYETYYRPMANDDRNKAIEAYSYDLIRGLVSRLNDLGWNPNLSLYSKFFFNNLRNSVVVRLNDLHDTYVEPSREAQEQAKIELQRAQEDYKMKQLEAPTDWGNLLTHVPDREAMLKNAGKYDHIDFKPPKSVADAAARGLELRKKNKGKGGLNTGQAKTEGVGSGVQRAVNLKNRDTMSPSTVRRMKAFFDRHKKSKKIDKGETASTDKGRIAWLLWGGDPGRSWANKVVRQMEAADRKTKKASVDVLCTAAFACDQTGFYNTATKLDHVLEVLAQTPGGEIANTITVVNAIAMAANQMLADLNTLRTQNLTALPQANVVRLQQYNRAISDGVARLHALLQAR